MSEILKVVIPSLSVGGLLLLLLLLVPEKIEKWSALLWKALSQLRGIFSSAHKKYLKHDIQGRVNDFSKRLRKKTPGLADERISVHFVDPTEARNALFDRDELIVRLRRDDPHDQNFVHGAYLFVSAALLRKPKRYLSPSQRDALDLYVCSKLLQEEKISVVDFFLREYLHPKTDQPKSKVAVLVDDYSVIDSGGLFYPLLLQELEYLGNKVFGRRRDDLVHAEVRGLIEFLKPIATRKVGEENDLEYDGQYCRFGIVMVGKPSKMMQSLEPYVGYVQKVLVDRGAETIYLLARQENKAQIDEVCRRFSNGYEVARQVQFQRHLHYEDRSELAEQYLAILRKKGIQIVQPSQ